MKVGDVVNSWAGIGRITFIRRSATGEPERARIILQADGTISKLLNCSSLEVLE